MSFRDATGLLRALSLCPLILVFACGASNEPAPGASSSGGTSSETGGASAAGAVGDGGSLASAGNSASGGAVATTGGSAGWSGTLDSAPIGWASVDANGQNGTTGGGTLEPTLVTSITELTLALSGNQPAVVQIAGSISGSVGIGSNKTLTGAPGAVFQGSIAIKGAVNVIVQNLKIVGNNCVDNADCQSGADAMTIENSAHHVWVDHCDISDGSDGNLDITSASDYVSVSWTKFSYSGKRAGGHQFSNLIGSSDTATGDAGHLKVTWYNDWWAANVGERMPRVRFGQVHIFNSLYTSSGNSQCVQLGVSGNVLTENNDFLAVKNPINVQNYSDANSILVSHGNSYLGCTGQAEDKGTDVFMPPYPYTLAAVDTVQATVESGAGPH